MHKSGRGSAIVAFLSLVTGIFPAWADETRAAGECPAAFYQSELGIPEGSSFADLRVFSLNGSAWREHGFDSIPLHRSPPPRDTVRFPAIHYPYRLDTPFSAGKFIVDFKSLLATLTSSGDTIFLSQENSGGARSNINQIRELVKRERCDGQPASELEYLPAKDPGNLRWFYLLRCKGKGSKKAADAQFSRDQLPVRFNSKDLSLSSADFSYLMDPVNQMLFKRLEISHAETAGGVRLLPYLENGGFDIRADFKNFFTMHFTSGNVESKVVAFQEGISGTIVRLSFAMKVLFLRLDLQLATDVLFRRDMAFLPMTMKIPAEARRYVHPNTGVLYSWFSNEGISPRADWMRMPARQHFSSPKHLKEQSLDIAKKHCDGAGRCFFRAAVGREGGSIVAMDINIRKDLLLRGFYPQYVADPGGEKKEFGWSWSGKPEPGQFRQGLYFELSGLPAGEHGFEIWLRIFRNGNLAPGQIRFCPDRWNIRDLMISSSDRR